MLGPGARDQLKTLLAGPRDVAITKPKAHLHLLNDFAVYHVSGSKALQSFRFLASVANLEVEMPADRGPSPDATPAEGEP